LITACVAAAAASRDNRDSVAELARLKRELQQTLQVLRLVLLNPVTIVSTFSLTCTCSGSGTSVAIVTGFSKTSLKTCSVCCSRSLLMRMQSLRVFLLDRYWHCMSGVLSRENIIATIMKSKFLFKQVFKPSRHLQSRLP
jgi:hypothetical protein